MVESILINYLVKTDKRSAGLYLAVSPNIGVNSVLLHQRAVLLDALEPGVAPRLLDRLK